MSSITYLPIEGAPVRAEIMPDMTLMELALINDVPGILGLCGGICSCATCHVHVSDDWIDRLPAPSVEEREMVEALSHASRGSRLGCQVRVDEAMDGLVVTVAPPE